MKFCLYISRLQLPRASNAFVSSKLFETVGEEHAWIGLNSDLKWVDGSRPVDSGKFDMTGSVMPYSIKKLNRAFI